MANLSRSILMAVTGILCCGCSSEDSSDAASATSMESQETAKSFKEAVTDAIALRDRIRDGFASGDVDAAHGPLHDIGHCLLAIPEAAAAELTSEDSQKVAAAVDELMDAYGEVDKTLHGADGSTYEEEALAIDNGFLTLTELAGISKELSAGKTVPATDPPGNASSAEIQEAAEHEVPPIQDAAEIQDASPPPAP